MTTFAWLLVAHLVGDWMLQNDWMARHKQKSFFNRAIAVHCLMYTFTTFVSLWLIAFKELAHPSYLLCLTLIFCTHWVIDALALAHRWAIFFKQSDQRFVQTMVDQTMHIVILACLAQFLL